MSKVIGPLLSLDAKGTVGKTITYKRNRSGLHVRRYKKPVMPPDRKTPRQLFSRAYFQNITTIWHASDSVLRSRLNNEASRISMSGYNLFISNYTMEKPSDVGNFCLGYSRLGVLT